MAVIDRYAQSLKRYIWLLIMSYVNFLVNCNQMGVNDSMSTLIQAMTWCRQATNHYPRQYIDTDLVIKSTSMNLQVRINWIWLSMFSTNPWELYIFRQKCKNSTYFHNEALDGKWADNNVIFINFGLALLKNCYSPCTVAHRSEFAW